MHFIYIIYIFKCHLFFSISWISSLYITKKKLSEMKAKKTIFLLIIFKRKKWLWKKIYFTKSNFENKFIQYSSIFSQDLFMDRVHREFLTCLVSLTNRHKKNLCYKYKSLISCDAWLALTIWFAERKCEKTEY